MPAIRTDLDAGSSLRVVPGPGFLSVGGAIALPLGACGPGVIAEDTLIELVEVTTAQAKLDPQIVVVLAADPLPCPEMFYLPVANDVQGIGYRHGPLGETFDRSPTSRLEGIAFLNDWPYFEHRSVEFEVAFSHEIAHRWGARVHVRAEELPSDCLLGREASHWSYFLDSDGSPLEGNRIRQEGPQLFTSVPAIESPRFSQLDLYLMGVLPPAEVSESLLLVGQRGAHSDCFGQPLTASSVPQFCRPLQFSASPHMIAVDNIIAAEGPRYPSATQGLKTIEVVVLLAGVEGGLAPDTCHQFAAAVSAAVGAFERLGGGRLALLNLVDADIACPRQQVASTSPQRLARGGGCAVHASADLGPSALWSLAAAWLLIRRLTASCRVQRRGG